MLAGMRRFGFLAVLFFGLALMLFPGCSQGTTAGGTDLQFAETAFKTLISGDVAAESMLDFETLNVMGMDVGKMYVAVPDETNKATFRKSYISGMGSSFKNSGINTRELKNWRLHSSDATKSVVATDWAQASLYVTVTKRTGNPMISAIGLAP